MGGGSSKQSSRPGIVQVESSRSNVAVPESYREPKLFEGLIEAGTKRRTSSYPESNGGGYPTTTNGKASSVSTSLKAQWKQERENLVLWRHPIVVLHYFIRETVCLSSIVLQRVNNYRLSVGLSLLFILSLYISTYVNGPHQAVVLWLEKRALWCLYWTGLGVLSSVGLGTGFHTFLLYLGPHIAKVSMAAYECGTLAFPEPPYPDEILCPDTESLAGSVAADWAPSLWSIMLKVKLEAMMWGAGTALGELPPYFLSRAARLSLLDPDDVDDLVELEELHKKQQNPETMTLVDKMKLKIETLVNKVGFFGILACASIPNPLFDLAGITCGHFLIPFWTFFGATLIGKAVIKMSIQVIVVIVAFNETLINRVLAFLKLVPLVGSLLVESVTNLWQRQKHKLHHKQVDTSSPNILL
uniref:Vacuole membrane protein 1 n=1 Tax=Cacopsylla melanoneura TaxID=428564 RepID=A0A8D8R805_9HEMI